jgi:uncharacterized protein
LYTTNVNNYSMILISGLAGGFILELLYRSLSARKVIQPKLINCILYGLVAASLYSVYQSSTNIYLKIFLWIVVPTLAELVYGLFFRKFMNIKLWDYSDAKYNYRGLICPEFSLYWAIISIVYVFVIIPLIV